MFKGAFTAIVTPFKDGKVDEEALKAHVNRLIENGTDGLVPCGSTGESATLTHAEHNRVIDITVETTAGRAPIIAGAGSNSTAETVKLTRHALEAGADAALLITPYYNKPSQHGLYEHYRTVAEAVDIPQILYNVPGRTGVNMLPETVASLSELKNIVGIKEATADMQQISDIIRASADDFCMLSGDDTTVLPFLSIGGHGVISVVANIAAADMSALCRAYLAGDTEKALELHYKLLPLSEAMFVDSNPVPVKTALAILGQISEELRLPLVALSSQKRAMVETALRNYGLI
ncbi:MAG: 4-hydroxy-tetrahydrodipicolinate synthase [Thermodesulfobacteriota bacterium]